MSVLPKVGRRIFKRSKSLVARASSTAVQPYSSKHNDLTDKWLARLRASAHGYTATENYSQLSSLVDYYNKTPETQELAPIDWEKWEDEIHTPKVVGKIKAKYDEFMQSQYEVEDGASRINSKTEKLESLDIAATYNHALWMQHYIEYVIFKEGITNLGDINDMSIKELNEYAPEASLANSTDVEIGNFSSPHDYCENSITGRIATQFMWGCKTNPPFVHSSDALSSTATTLGKLGK